jgi:hypothetical protein
MAERAECVMLNKGPYVVDAVRMLDDVLQRINGIKLKSLRCSGRWVWRNDFCPANNPRVFKIQRPRKS